MKQQVSKPLAAGAAVVLAPERAAWSLGVTLEAGASVTLELTATPARDHGANGATARWHGWVTLTASEMLMAPGPVTGIRATAAGAGLILDLVS